MIKTLVWASEYKTIEAFKLEENNQNASIFISDINNTKFKILSKEFKRTNSDRIIKINDNYSFDLIFKRNSVWTTIKFNDLISYAIISNDYRVANNESWVPKELTKGKKTSNITYPFEITDQVSDYIEFLKLIIDDNFFSKIKMRLENKMLNTAYEKFKIKEEKYFDDFVNKITNGKLQGIEATNVSFCNEDLKISTKFGDIHILKNKNNEIQLTTFFLTNDNRIAELFSFSKGILINIKNHINQNTFTTNAPKKIRKKDVLTWIISLLIVTFLLYATFNFIFTPHNLGISIKIIFSRYSWSHGWMYLMWMNFLFSIFMGPIIGILILKTTKPKNKINWKTILNFFISSQLRLVTVFLTGNSILATIVWAWYLSSTTKIRTVGLAGMVASMSILRGILLLPIGSFFMIRGSIFNATILSELGMQNELIAILSLSWIGWIWHIIHNLSISLLIVMPPLHILWNKMTLIRSRKETNISLTLDKMNTFEMNLISLKHSFKYIFKNKERLWRVVLIILFNILIETFEFTFGLKIVEGYAFNEGLISEVASYWNILAISSVRYMSGFIYHVPILNLLPGQGVGITDITLKLSTEGVIGHAHGWNGEFSNEQINDLGEQTTFLMRFFNFYLRRIIALLISTIFITRILILKKN